MKNRLFLFLLLPLVLTLTGCGFDESAEATQQHDGDDINVIQNIGPQALEQVFQSRSPIPSQPSSKPPTSSYTPPPTTNQPSSSPDDGEEGYEGTDD